MGSRGTGAPPGSRRYGNQSPGVAPQRFLVGSLVVALALAGVGVALCQSVPPSFAGLVASAVHAREALVAHVIESRGSDAMDDVQLGDRGPGAPVNSGVDPVCRQHGRTPAWLSGTRRVHHLADDVLPSQIINHGSGGRALRTLEGLRVGLPQKLAGSRRTWPGWIRSGSERISRLASKIGCQPLPA